MMCIECLKIKRDNPDLTDREIFPNGRVNEAISMVKGTAYCMIHLPKDSGGRKNK